MGWDAFAEPLKRHWNRSPHERLDEPAQSVFLRAASEVEALCDGHVEAAIAEGMLDFNESGQELQEHTGENCWPNEPTHKGTHWTPGLVRALAAKEWPPTDKSGEAAMHYWGARKFLDACAELGLGIRFSW